MFPQVELVIVITTEVRHYHVQSSNNKSGTFSAHVYAELNVPS